MTVHAVTTATPATPVILAIETSTSVARVGVFDATTGARRAAAEAVSDRHSSNLLRLCVEVTEAAGLAVSALGAIACGAGPGSFTGLRVGFAVAKGLAMPTGVPLLLVSSLEALAWDMSFVAAPGEWLLPCLDAGKGQVFAALFERQVGAAGATAIDVDGAVDAAAVAAAADIVARSEEWALAPGALSDVVPAELRVLCAGTGAARYRDGWATGFGARLRFADVAGPSADAVAARALSRFRRGEFADLATAVPAYGRAPDITRPKRPIPG
jgi:tRNA threonylcarbamoyladenosine biosynthesis protein TsaB